MSTTPPMPPARGLDSIVRTALFLAIACVATVQLHAANTLAWTGGGSSANWSEIGNWGFVATPAAGDTLIFPGGAAKLTNTNNLTGLALDQIRFAGASGGYEIRGNSFTLTNGIVATNAVGTNNIVNDFTMATNDVTVNAGEGAWLVFRGLITSSAGLTKVGAGTLELAIPAPYYSGVTRINAGTVELNAQAHDYAFAGGLMIGDGTGTGNPVLRMLAGLVAIPDNLEVVVNEGGLFDLNGQSEDVGSLRLTGGAVTGGNLVLYGGFVTAYAPVNSSYNNTISGSLSLLANFNEFNVANGASLYVSASVSANGDILKTGAGNMYFSGPNNYDVSMQVQEGSLWVESALALGSPNSGTIVSSGASLVLNGSFSITNESLQLSGVGVSGYGALDTGNGSGTNIWAGPIILNTTSTFSPYNNDAVLRLIGPISGAGGLTEFSGGTGQLILEGNSPNTFAGTTTIESGLLFLNKSGGATAIPGDLVINAGGVGGNGTVGNIFCAGNLLPGFSPGSLTGSNVAFTAAGNYHVELAGSGMGHDQLWVRGTNNLGQAALLVSTAFTSPVSVGNQFVIVDNDGAEANTGTFSGLPEGAPLNTAGYDFTVSYVGGNGNDVVLTIAAVHPGASVNSLARVTAGDGNGAIEPNECNYLAVVITNLTTTPMAGVSAVLSSLTPGVAITQPRSGYPAIAGSGTGTNATAFQISTAPTFGCGTNLNLLLTVTSASHGVFSIPVVLPSGSPAAVPSRYDVNTGANIPNPGIVESTNVVTGFAGPLKKVVVSLSLNYPWDSDLNISLISPDGVVVDLSSGNGHDGDNYGAGCSPDGNRTTFDDAAATAITSGSAPFVGTFKPEGSLAAMNGGTANGNWRLRIQDTYLEDAGALNCWSLFLYPVGCDAGSGVCELCPDVTITSVTGPASATQTGGVLPDFNPSICGVPKACPGSFVGGPYPSDSYSFRNGPSNACVTVTLVNTSSIVSMLVTAYTNSFNPANPNKCINYLADGGSPAGIGFSPTQSFSFNLSADATFVVNVWADSAGADAPYRLTVSGGSCRPVLNVSGLPGNQALLHWPTAAGGYQLESTNVLVPGGSSIWPPVTSPPVAINGRFYVTNDVATSNRFYHLRKPVP